MERTQELFYDSDFPATAATLFAEEDAEDGDVPWLRPHELCEQPEMYVDGASRCDVQQGILGDCWFLSACAAVAPRQQLLEKVIPPGQVLYGEGYTGKLSFRFWAMGKWVPIDIDDRLPTDGEKGLICARCTDPTEFWLPLLEKAFAKFHGSYHALDGGHLVEGFVNLTGFFVENLMVSDFEKNAKFFRRLCVENKHGSLLTCSRASGESQGLIGDHGYTISDVRKVRLDSGLVRLVRVRNPWGNQEWTGAWNDSDTKWQDLPEDIKESFEFTAIEDGEFWIKVAHFRKKFLEVCVSTDTPDLLEDSEVRTKRVFVMHGCWKAGINAGGCQNDLPKFATNPQYLLTVLEADDPESDSDDEDSAENGPNEASCDVLIELMQEHRRSLHKDLHTIAFYVVKTNHPSKRLTVDDFQEINEVEAMTVYDSLSSVMCRVSLKPGKYVVIPTTYDPDLERRFLLRICSRKPIMITEITDT